jgi:prepilin-type N-terminal cleavage/methylation domain-containing protein
MPQRMFQRRAGFTLVEVLLAMLVFAIAITTILALLARSIESVNQIVLKDEAMRLSGAVEEYMRGQPFNTSYGLVGAGRVLHTFNYRAAPVTSGSGSEGNLPTRSPPEDRSGIMGKDYWVVPGVSSLPDGDSTLTGFFRAREGRWFKVRLTLSASNPIPLPANMPPNPDNYPHAVVVIYAEFYPVSNPNIPTPWLRGTTAVKPVFAYNFAVRR